MSLKTIIKSNGRLKHVVHRLMFSRRGVCPRFWVKWLVNPIFFFKTKEWGSIIRRSVELNVSPINRFALGKGSMIEHFSVIDNAMGEVSIGHDTIVGAGNTVIGPVTIGNNVILAQNVVVSALNHNYQDSTLPIKNQGVNFAKIEIEDDSWIAANSVITSGVTIGKHSVVAGGSVVTKDVPPYSVVAGVPAIVIKRFDSERNLWLKC